MTAPGGGGDRLEVPVVVDATGAAKGLQSRLDAEIKNVRARIKAEIDTARLAAQAAAAAKRTEQQTKVSLKVGVDRRYLAESIKAALREFSTGEHRIKVGVDVDGAKVQDVLDQVSAGGESKIDVDADTDGANTKIDGMRRSQEHRPINVPVKADTRAAQKVLGVLGKVGMFAGKIALVTSAAVGLGGGLLSVAAAGTQAAGVLAALPSLAGIAAQGIGAIFAGFSGIGDAVGAMGKTPSGGGGGGAAAAKAQEQAQRRVADARQRVADVIESGDRRIARAEEAVGAAQQRAQRAQESLNRAREAARERLEDYQLSLKGAALDEESATLAVERARERWNETMRSPVSTELDRKEVDLALRQAEQRLAEVKESNDDLHKETDAAFQAGIEGSAEVLSAQEEVAQANREVADSERELADERRDTVRDLADAQRDLADAISDASDAAAGGVGGIDALADAMAKLSPEGQKFAKFVNDTLKPRIQQLKFAIQDAILPGVQSGIEKAMPFLDVLQAGMVETGTVVGGLATKLGELMGSDAFGDKIAKIMASNNVALGSFGNAGISLVSVLSDIAVAAGPMVETFAAWVDKLTAGWAATTGTAEGGQKLTEFFDKASAAASTLGSIVGDLIGILFGVGKQGVDSGQGLLDSLAGVVSKWHEWVDSPEGQERIQKFFEDVRPLMEKAGEILAKVGEAFLTVGEDGTGGLDTLLSVVDKLLDGLLAVLNSPFGPFLSSLLAVAGVAGGASLALKNMLGFGGPGGGGGFSTMIEGFKQIKEHVAGAKDMFDRGKEAFATAKQTWSNTQDFIAGFKGGADAAADLGTKAAGAGSKVAELGGKVWSAASTGASTVATWATTAAQTAGHFVAMAAAATVNAAKVTATWIVETAKAGASVAASWATNTAKAIASWAGMALAATGNALKVAAVWLAQTALTTGGVLIGWAIAVATVVGGWVLMGVQSLLAAARMAAAWLIALGPIGWAIAAVIGLVALIIANWDTVKSVTERVFGAIASFVSGIWSGLGSGLKAAINGIIRLFNTLTIGGINLLISGVNKIPGVNIPKIPSIPYLADGAVVDRPTLAVVGEDGPEAVIPLSAGRAGRRDELMKQAGLDGLAGLGAASTPADMAALGGWGPLDAASQGRPLASVVAAGATAEHRPAQQVGTMIAEGAIQMTVVNPVPETATETLNARMRRLASVGIFDSKPGT